ncbi:MAG: hypothetical protein V4537_15755 [Pseudomonadota bacterium]
MTGRVDAAQLLERALVAHAGSAGFGCRIVAESAKRWASATFVGAHHRLRIEATACPPLRDWLAGLADADLPLRGHLVADLSVVDQRIEGDRLTATIEVLTVEEA